MPNISATGGPTRKKFIYSGHFEKKLDREGGPFKNAEWGGSPKLIKSNLTYQLQAFTKHFTVNDNNNAYSAEILAKFHQLLAKFHQISAEMWVIIGEFDNFSQIKVSKCNFEPITGLQCHNA